MSISRVLCECYWPERILKFHLYTQVAVCPVLTLHRHPEHPRITATGGEGKDGEELEQEEEEKEEEE